MAFRSCPRKNVPGNNPGVMELLLRDGWTIPDPDQEALATASRLEQLGLVKIGHREFVLCSNPLDDDFPPPVRHCQGRILLLKGLDEGGDEFRCSECERPVYPFLDSKHTHKDVRSQIDLAGVVAFVREELEAMGTIRQMAGGVFRVEIADGEVLVCLVEVCRDHRYLSLEHARLHPTLFIAVDSRNLKERFLPDPWLAKVSLVDLVTGSANLPSLLEDMLAQGEPSVLINASLPVYDKVVPMLKPVPVAGMRRRAFMVEFGSDLLQIEGTLVATKATTQMQVFGILWKRFLEDMTTSVSPDDFRPISVDDLTDIIDPGNREEAVDVQTIRKAINRLQQELMETVRRELGLPIERDDIIQNVRNVGPRRKSSGFRINPRMVLPRVSPPS